MLKVFSTGRLRTPSLRWLIIGLAIVLVLAVFLWRLGSQTPGLSNREVNYITSSEKLSTIKSNPVNAPHKLIQNGIIKIAPGRLKLARLASVIFGLIFCIAFYYLAKSWFGQPVGTFAALIFGCLPLLLISARQAVPSIMFFSPVVFMSLYNWLIKTNRYKALAWFGLNVAAAVFIYTPGMLMWMLGAFLICRKQIFKAVAEIPATASVLGLLIFGLSLAGLGASTLPDSSSLKQFLLVPASFGSGLAILKHTGWMILSFFIKTGQPDALLINRLPILSIILIVLLIFGVYAMYIAARNKAGWLGLAILYAVVAAGINNNVEMLALALPAIGLFIAAGLRYIYIEWRSVFPRNPVPKTFALVLISLVVLTQLYFGLRYSLAAWPGATATQASYVLK